MPHCSYSDVLLNSWLFAQRSVCISQIKISENVINAARLFNLFKNKIKKINWCQEERNFLLWFLGKCGQNFHNC